MAGGFTIKKENIPLFRDFLIKNFKKSQLSSSKVVNLYLDSVIAPSALNEEFYSEIEKLAPFGSGNSEPKFVIENLQVITSDLVADKHIKTVLYGKDGSVIKSIAFNAKDSPLEPFLTKKNKKKFNIAGKMNLNEWRGKKSVEFIIEDISLH
jgi:single-stranded-DNA-specific exonuclease